jgi:hypothetical protein
MSDAEVTGTVLRSPVRPLEPADGPPSTSPVAGAELEVVSGQRLVMRATADSHGRFSVRVPPGQYVVSATFAGGVPRSRATTILDVGSEPVTVTLVLDSGIR